MKAIIIGAGSSTRISEYSQNIPKCLLDINGKTILEYQVSLFIKNKINDIIVITGPHRDKFNLKNITYVHDSNYTEHDILGSLMAARSQIEDEVLITYSDIIFDESVLRQILESKSDIAIAIDLEWEKSYLGRTDNPKSEAENVLLNNTGNITQIQKNIQNKNGHVGEFLGIMKLSSEGSKTFVKIFEMLEKSHVGTFHKASSLNKAYLTDMIQELIDSKVAVTPIIISGNWCEIDTPQDLESARTYFNK